MVAVKLARKVKQSAKISFKDRPHLISVVVPLTTSITSFSFIEHENDAANIIRRVLRANDIHMNIADFEMDSFILSDKADMYPYFAGSETDELTGITTSVWTSDEIWF